MSNKNTKLLIAASLTFLAAISFTACQQNSQAEHAINKGDRPRVVKNNTPVEGIYPTMKLTAKSSTDANAAPTTKDFQLKSQTSRYTNGAGSALEITLTNSKSASCQNENPTLAEGESVIKITVQSKDGKALAKGTYTSDQYELAGSINTIVNGFKQEEKFSSAQIKSITVTDLNKAIFRGNLDVAGANTALSGEFFTAICK